MNEIKKLLSEDPYSMNSNRKKNFQEFFLNKLTSFHYSNSYRYRKILVSLNYKKNNKSEIHKIPFLPVRLFKDYELVSVKKNKIIKTLNSSGTTGSKPSKIFLDKENALNQVKVLQIIINKVLGTKRLPMLIIDKNLKDINRLNFNARVAAINGFSIFGRSHTFLLNEKNEIDYKTLNKFLKKYGSKKFFIFGFTSLIFENLINKLSSKLIVKNMKNGILIHGGGWKKLENLKISNKIFKEKLKKKVGLENIHNYYGLVEQTGSIFIECKCGYFIASNFSEVFIRDSNFNLLDNNKKGFLQLISLLPKSYPGHNILTEDIAEIIDNAKCSCHLKGKRFLVHGRVKEAEIRGCSDT